MAKFDTHELAWCAGFFDGEGSSYSYIENGNTVIIASQVGQKDSSQLLLKRFQKAINGYGLIRGAGKKKVDFYLLRLRGFELTQYTICLIWKWLGPIKKEQYKKAVRFYLLKCYKAKSDKELLRRREIYKYGSVGAMKTIRMNKYLANISNNKLVINPFEKAV
jgi:hypothetical protein